MQKFQTLKTQYEQTKAQGLDVSEVERLGKEAKQAFDKGDYKTANELLEKAKNALDKTKISEKSPTTTPKPTSPKPPEIKNETSKKTYSS